MSNNTQNTKNSIQPVAPTRNDRNPFKEGVYRRGNISQLQLPPEDVAEQPRVRTHSHEHLFRDEIFSYGNSVEKTTSISGTPTDVKKRVGGSVFNDVIVPFSHHIDLTILSNWLSKNSALVAQKEKPRIPPPLPVPLEQNAAPSAQMLGKKTAFESPVMAKKGSSIRSVFSSFVDWVSNIFSKKGKKGAEDDDWKSRLESPTRRAEQIRDCLKKLNEAIERMKEVAQTSEGTLSADTSASLALFLLIFIDQIKKRESSKKTQLTNINYELTLNQKRIEELQKRHFEALDKISSLKWITKGASFLNHFGTGFAIFGAGAASALLLATFATGGVSGVLGGFAAIAAFFAVTQAISAGMKGISAGVKAGVDYKTGKHQGEMIDFRAHQDALSLASHELAEELASMLTSTNKIWELMSKIESNHSSTIRISAQFSQ